MTTGHEKDRFTVMLACLEDVTKPAPYVVFKQKTLPKDLVLPRGIHVRAQGVDGRITCETLAVLCLVQSWQASTKKKSPCVGLFQSSLK